MNQPNRATPTDQLFEPAYLAYLALLDLILAQQRTKLDELGREIDALSRALGEEDTHETD